MSGMDTFMGYLLTMNVPLLRTILGRISYLFLHRLHLGFFLALLDTAVKDNKNFN